MGQFSPRSDVSRGGDSFDFVIPNFVIPNFVIPKWAAIAMPEKILQEES